MKKRNWLTYLPTIFVISIIISLIAYSTQGNSVQMNYTTFEQAAEHVEFQDSSVTIGETIIRVNGTYTDTKSSNNNRRLILNAFLG